MRIISILPSIYISSFMKKFQVLFKLSQDQQSNAPEKKNQRREIIQKWCKTELSFLLITLPLSALHHCIQFRWNSFSTIGVVLWKGKNQQREVIQKWGKVKLSFLVCALLLHVLYQCMQFSKNQMKDESTVVLFNFWYFSLFVAIATRFHDISTKQKNVHNLHIAIYPYFKFHEKIPSTF